MLEAPITTEQVIVLRVIIMKVLEPDLITQMNGKKRMPLVVL